MDNDVKICLPGFRLHSAVCFSTAPLSKIFRPAACYKLQPLVRQRVGMVVRIEEKRREEKRREGSNQKLKFLKLDFPVYCSHLNNPYVPNY
ncbi:MAG: hypothetical protein M0P50_12505 [Bacteroidales bacterium]|nr:hypothetical protein [Bacteroidales bacterium]